MAAGAKGSGQAAAGGGAIGAGVAANGGAMGAAACAAGGACVAGGDNAGDGLGALSVRAAGTTKAGAGLEGGGAVKLGAEGCGAKSPPPAMPPEGEAGAPVGRAVTPKRGRPSAKRAGTAGGGVPRPAWRARMAWLEPHPAAARLAAPEVEQVPPPAPGPELGPDLGPAPAPPSPPDVGASRRARVGS